MTNSTTIVGVARLPMIRMTGRRMLTVGMIVKRLHNQERHKCNKQQPCYEYSFSGFLHSKCFWSITKIGSVSDKYNLIVFL